MFALRDGRRGVAGDAKGQGTRVWYPWRVGDPREEVGAWTVAMETATTAKPLHRVTPVKSGGVGGTERTGEKKKRKGEGGAKKAQENPANDSYAYRTKHGEERTRRNVLQRS